MSATMTMPEPIGGNSLWLRLLLRLANRLPVGNLTVISPDGARHVFKGPLAGPSAELRLLTRRAARRFFIGGHVGFAEGYLAGEWDSPDLASLLELAALAQDRLGQKALSGGLLGRLAHRFVHRLRDNTRAGSRRNIAAHYDLGNAFYEKWLDPSMTYSSALYAEPGTDLGVAQEAKYRRIAERLQLNPDHHLLEIGCGWGGFAEFAARSSGCRVTAITVSPAQFDYASARIARQGLNERVTLALRDYRDVGGVYDRIASIEMIEAVGERWWPTYFSTLRERLAPGGFAALQAITIADRFFDEYRRGADFIQRYVFPGGMLPSPGTLRGFAGRFGLHWVEDAGFGLHYAQTLAEWRDRFEAAWHDIRPLGFDERFRRLWHYYLAYCEAGFRAGTVDLQQIVLQRG